MIVAYPGFPGRDHNSHVEFCEEPCVRRGEWF